jgi:hypothetical protein
MASSESDDELLLQLDDGLVAERDDLVEALPLPAGTGRSDVRLMLLGALNWAPNWYRPGKQSPRGIARGFVNILRSGLVRG